MVATPNPRIPRHCGSPFKTAPTLLSHAYRGGSVAGIAGGLWPHRHRRPKNVQRFGKPSRRNCTARFLRSGEDTFSFVFSDLHRHNVVNNWLIIGKPINQPLTPPDRRDLVQPIFRMLHSPEFAERAMEQMVHDSEGKGFNAGDVGSPFPESRKPADSSSSSPDFTAPATATGIQSPAPLLKAQTSMFACRREELKMLWHFRGSLHVHCWVHVRSWVNWCAQNASIQLYPGRFTQLTDSSPLADAPIGVPTLKQGLYRPGTRPILCVTCRHPSVLDR